MFLSTCTKSKFALTLSSAPLTEADLGSMVIGESYKKKELNLLSLKERRKLADMIQTFKTLQNFSDVNPATWFSRINHSRVTRNATDP